MKEVKILAISCFILVSMNSCTNTEYRYIDINSGKRIDVITDSATGMAIDSVTRQPVSIYYDTQTKDTIFGKTGKVINNQVVRTADGKYDYIEPLVVNPVDSMKVIPDNTKSAEQHDLEMLNKYGKYKKKVSKDGDIKIVEGDKKIKVDGETGVKTVKDK